MKASKWFLLLLAVCLVFSLAACGGGDGGSDTSADNGGNGDDPAGGGNGGGNGGDNGGGSGGGNSAPAGPWLCFTAGIDNSSVFLRSGEAGNVGSDRPRIEFAYESGGNILNWQPYNMFIYDSTDSLVSEGFVIPLNKNQKVYIRAIGQNEAFSNYIDGYNYRCVRFKMTGSIAASGNLMSLLDKNCETQVIPNNSCFYNLFYSCKSLTTAPELPATTLTKECYSCMFFGCSSLIEVPTELPAITLAVSCYNSMFNGCKSLTTAPELPATTLKWGCYAQMFYGCSKLKNITVYFTDWDEAPNATS